MLFKMTQLAKQRRLHLSNQEEVGANVIALDSVRKKLLFAKNTPLTTSCLIIDLNDLEACSVKKEYKSIPAGELKSKKLHHFLKCVFLNFVFKTGTVSLPMYEAKKLQEGNIEQLETQANHWQSTISKLLLLPVRERA